MSCEVRRVPLSYAHPVVPDPHWANRRRTAPGPGPALVEPGMSFVGLLGDYRAARADWERETGEYRARSGDQWAFRLAYHLTGYQGRGDAAPATEPVYVSEAAPEVDARDEDHLQELLLAAAESEKPDPGDYMPVWPGPVEALGWCLFETLTAGTPVTPVFATSGELVDHLATVPREGREQAMRREAADQLVCSGGSVGSVVAVRGAIYDAVSEADRVTAELQEK